MPKLSIAINFYGILMWVLSSNPARSPQMLLFYSDAMIALVLLDTPLTLDIGSRGWRLGYRKAPKLS